jgi:hypothetical protein
MVIPRSGRRLSLAVISLTLVGVASFSPSPALAERPAAARLLPKETALYVRIADTRDLAARFRETGLGRIGGEAEVEPIVKQLYGSTVQEFSEIEERLGVPLDKLLAMPRGEIALAVVPVKNAPPARVLLLDVGEETESVAALLERIDGELLRRGATPSSENVGETRLNVFELPAGRMRQFVYFQRQGTLAVSTDLAVARRIVSAWNGGGGEVLADNESFAAVMSRTRASQDEPAQIAWYVDPIGLMRASRRNSVFLTTTLALLPVLGLDGVQGLGGGISLATADYDLLVHVHLLLDQPRTGVLEALALGQGDTTPEPWVPADATSYATLHWDVEKTLGGVRTVYDSINGEQAFDRFIKLRFSFPLGVEADKEIFPALAGRFSRVTWYERPPRINSESRLFAAQLKDPAAFARTLETIAEKFKDRMTADAFGGVTYYRIALGSPPGNVPEAPDGARDAPQPQPRRPRFRGPPPDPCVAIVDDYLLVSDRPSLLQHAIVTRADASQSLAQQLDYKLIAGRIERQAAGHRPGMVNFGRPELQLRALYDLAASEENRQRLAEASEADRRLRPLSDTLRGHPLPPFAVISRHLAPGGGMFTNEETGYHYTGFILRRAMDGEK